jgi:hypothetical protein
MDKVKIVDRFINLEEYEICTQKIKMLKWIEQRSDHSLNLKDNLSIPFWVSYISDDTFFSEHLLKKIEKHFNKKFKINRLYVNCQSFGQDGYYHLDERMENNYTFCLYVHDNDDDICQHIGGHLNIKIPNEKFVYSIEPFVGRGVLFPANYFHKGCAFNNNIYGMRYCIAWKLVEESTDSS